MLTSDILLTWLSLYRYISSQPQCCLCFSKQWRRIDIPWPQPWRDGHQIQTHLHQPGKRLWSSFRYLYCFPLWCLQRRPHCLRWCWFSWWHPGCLCELAGEHKSGCRAQREIQGWPRRQHHYCYSLTAEGRRQGGCHPAHRLLPEW